MPLKEPPSGQSPIIPINQYHLFPVRPSLSPKEFLEIDIPRNASALIESDSNPQQMIFHHFQRKAGIVMEEKWATLTPGVRFGKIN